MGGFRFENIYHFPNCSGKDEIPEGESPKWRCRKKARTMAQQQEEEVEKLRLSSVEEVDKFDETQDYHRGTWTRKCDFLLSIVGYSVGVSNIWRFPYLCMRNGGGAFLIPFFFFLIFCGIPLFFMELCLGQFSGVSSLFVWSLCPLFKGLGYLMVIVSFIMSWYYIMVLVWVIYYLVNSFYDPLPWAVCTNSWNTPFCIEDRGKINISRTLLNNLTSVEVNTSLVIGSNYTSNTTVTAAKEFWQLNVLQISSGFADLGGIRWHLVLALAAAWVLVFLCLMKGVKSVGKVVYVTALLPYVLLTIFLIRGLLLPGAVDGIMFYLTPDFKRLLEFQVWLEAGIQVFYSLGPAWGGLITMSSYNKFTNNCLRDAIIGSMADALTSFYGGFVIFSVLGYMAYESKLPINEVATSGPGLALVAYPEAITKLPFPQLWAVLFFLMLLALGIDSQFGTFETVSSGLVDAFPRQLGKRKVLLTAALSLVLFILGLPFTTNGGMYIFQLVDWYAASLCVLLTCFLECFIVGWLYGADRFSRDVELMMGRPVPVIIRLCWCVITPLIMMIAFIATMINYQPPTYEGYHYPGSARAFGLLLSVIPIIPVPVLMVSQIVKAKGSIVNRIWKLTQPTLEWGPHISKYREMYQTSVYPRLQGLQLVRANLFGAHER
ncbi:sodium- and chloride-dependent betaine transporter-like [Mizuhopecten yessoensis]|uniref:Transporter n=1 Tax=Mizuhopecten yessoensis TaxID=6573 RepID=A0A210R666_MIZYE|nr:sodium- and chloride-dependent betaine transporter-like [Mizuhopecten yessoensis]OWF56398.1 Sodium- and chloride-dependent glycine transporter 2 [Mizuhopecten yessoensis]